MKAIKKNQQTETVVTLDLTCDSHVPTERQEEYMRLRTLLNSVVFVAMTENKGNQDPKRTQSNIENQHEQLLVDEDVVGQIRKLVFSEALIGSDTSEKHASRRTETHVQGHLTVFYRSTSKDGISRFVINTLVPLAVVEALNLVYASDLVEEEIVPLEVKTPHEELDEEGRETMRKLIDERKAAKKAKVDALKAEKDEKRAQQAERQHQDGGSQLPRLGALPASAATLNMMLDVHSLSAREAALYHAGAAYGIQQALRAQGQPALLQLLDRANHCVQEALDALPHGGHRNQRNK